MEMNQVVKYENPSAVASAEMVKAKIQSAYVIAYQKPRKIDDARDAIIKACKRTEFAAKAEYKKPVGGKVVNGPSVRFIELALRAWGNIFIDTQVIFEDDETRVSRVLLIDLETNTHFSKDVSVKKTIERKSKKNREADVVDERKNVYGETVYILRATDEEFIIKEAIAISKTIRNEGARLFPTDFIEEGLAQARETLKKGVAQDPDTEKKRILDAFSGIGVKPSELAAFLKHSIETISTAEIADLKTIYQAIKDGESSWNDFVADSDYSDIESEFDNLVKNKKLKAKTKKQLEAFIKKIAKEKNKSEFEVKEMASENFELFLKAFEEEEKKQDQTQQKQKENKKDEETKNIDMSANWYKSWYSTVKRFPLEAEQIRKKNNWNDYPVDEMQAKEWRDEISSLVDKKIIDKENKK